MYYIQCAITWSDVNVIGISAFVNFIIISDAAFEIKYQCYVKSRIFAPVPSQEPLAFVGLVHFVILVSCV